MFLDVVKDYSPCRHVDPHGKRLGGKEELNPAPLEQHLNHFLQNREDTAMVDPDAPLEKFRQLQNLRQNAVGLLKLRLHSSIDKVVNLRLFGRSC